MCMLIQSNNENGNKTIVLVGGASRGGSQLWLVQVMTRRPLTISLGVGALSFRSQIKFEIHVC